MSTEHVVTAGPSHPRGPWIRAILIVVIGMALTLVGTTWLQERARHDAEMRFERYNAKITATVLQRFENSVIALKGLRSTFHAYGGHMDRLAFRAWVDARHIEVDFPGLRGLGFIERVERTALPAFLARERADAAPDFSVRTSGDAPDLFVIKLIEPLQNNRAAWGYDVGSEPVRRAAAQQAVDTGLPTLTGRITLVQDGKKGPGFLYFMPIYRAGEPLDTVEARRRSLIGLLYTPIVVAELMRDMHEITDELIDFELLMGGETSPDHLLFDLDGHLSRADQRENPGTLHHQVALDVGGRTLTLQTRTTDTFVAETRDLTALGFGLAGSLLSALLAGMFWMTSMNQARAESLAHRMTQDLRDSQRRTENALREQRALLETLERHSLISVTDRAGTILEVNDAFCAISHYSREELIGATHRLVNSQHHDPFFWVDMWQTISSGQSWQGEICNRNKDGDLYWVSSIIAPFFNEEGTIEKYISIRQDITQRKQLEAEAKQMAERYTLAIEGGSDGLWDWIDVKQSESWWSPQFYRLLGFEPDEIPAGLVTLDSLLHPEDRRRTLDAIHRALSDASPFDIDHRLRTKDGDFRWFRSRAKVYCDEYGAAHRMAGSLQDIHDMRLAQQRLAEHTDHMAAIFSLTPDAFVSFDQQGFITYASPAFEALTSMPCETVQGWSEEVLLERLNEMSTEPLSPETRAALHEDAPQHERVLLALHTPKSKRLEISLQRGRGASVSQVMHLRDVTRETELERMKAEFLSVAAHELRTPMASIYGFTELLLTRADLKPEKQRDLLHRIFRQSEVMVTIINELLDLARIEARRGKDLKLESLDLAALVAEVVRDHRVPDQRKAPVVSEPDGPLWVRGDVQKTRQAVLNVLSNAYKYSPDGGDVEIGFVVETAQEGSPPRTGVRIRDHGVGLTPEQLARIGERFFRADKSGRIPGTGLGLSIVQEFLKLMGGSMAVDSVHGQGTTVTLWLPPSV